MLYRNLNRTLLLVGLLAGVAICIFQTGCPLQRLTGRCCLFCGCSRDFFGMFSGKEGFINPYSPYIFGLLAFECLYRSLFSAVLAPRWLVVADIVLSACLLALMFVQNLVIMFS